MLHAVGFTRADFSKPQIGVCAAWSEVTPCNMHLDALSARASAGVSGAGGKPVAFGTITVSDGISMGTEGMKYSLVSREVIADSIETVTGAEGFDGLVAIGGCDKNMPAMVMAMARLNRPAVFVYGGTIMPGIWHGQPVDIVSVFEAVGQHAAGRLSDAELADLEQHACPGAGSCGGMYTANTMASAIEALGLSLPNSSAQAAISPDKQADAERAGAAVVALVERNLRPRDILTRQAFENAITTVIALGGSTNAVLHLLAMAHSAQREAVARRLHAHRPTGAGAGRSEAERPLRHGGTGPHRRHHAAPQAPARSRPAAWRRDDGHRPDPGREPEGRRRLRAGPAGGGATSPRRSRRTAIS